MPTPIRIGAVSYLNTLPLVHGLRRGMGAERIALSYDVPAGLARSMTHGELDVALLPVAALPELPAFEVVPGLGITTHGASRSVLLLTRVPLERVENVALDGESRTSNALVQVLFDRVWNRRPRFERGPASLDSALREYDAAVRIGDKALFEPRPEGLHVHDLGAVWTEATGLPFVFAVWTARPGVVDRELYRTLHDSRRAGRQALDEIAETFEWYGRRDPELVRVYLREHILYRLGSSELKAIRLFLDAARGLDLIERVPEITMALARRTACHDTADRLRDGRMEERHVPK